MPNYKIMVVCDKTINDTRKATHLCDLLKMNVVPEGFNQIEVYLAQVDSDLMRFKGFRTHRLYVSESIRHKKHTLNRNFMPMMTDKNSENFIRYYK